MKNRSEYSFNESLANKKDPFSSKNKIRRSPIESFSTSTLNESNNDPISVENIELDAVIGTETNISGAKSLAFQKEFKLNPPVLPQTNNKFSLKISYIKQRMDCSKNNYGCMQNICWTNCGPRNTSADWCFTTNQQSSNSENVTFAHCVKYTDCNPCWQCGASCILEDLQHGVPALP